MKVMSGAGKKGSRSSEAKPTRKVARRWDSETQAGRSRSGEFDCRRERSEVNEVGVVQKRKVYHAPTNEGSFQARFLTALCFS